MFGMLPIGVAVIVLLQLCLHAVAQIPCDDAYGAHCPEASGWAVGECLKQAPTALSSDCLVYIAIHDACRGDIETHCNVGLLQNCPCLTLYMYRTYLIEDLLYSLLCIG